jgi:DNA-binding NtrC family response regulator
VLIIDDEPHLRLLYETEFRRAGIEPLSAASAEQALEYLLSTRPDLIVLDLRMPGMDGVEAMQRILFHDSSIPIVINTAYGGYRGSFQTWAADAFIRKSSDVTELLQTVLDLLPLQAVRT